MQSATDAFGFTAGLSEEKKGRTGICSCCCLVCCSLTCFKSLRSAFWTAPPSYSQPLVAASVAAIFHFPLLHEVVLFSQIKLHCQLHFFDFLPPNWCSFILYLIFPLFCLCPAKVLYSSVSHFRGLALSDFLFVILRRFFNQFLFQRNSEWVYITG